MTVVNSSLVQLRSTELLVKKLQSTLKITYFGDESKSEVLSANNGIFDDLIVKNAITVEGGVNQNRTSQFYGPVSYTNKVTVSSEEGLETNVFFLKGDFIVSKKMTVGIQTPIIGKRPGDISFKAIPEPGGYVGHMHLLTMTGEDGRNFYRQR